MHLRDSWPAPSTLLAAADAFVLDSFFEGWPLVTMEALIAGLPVVMSEVGGAWEQVGSDGLSGYLVPNPLGDPEQLTWDAIYGARFAPQANKDALVTAMISAIDERERWIERREIPRSDSPRRFEPELCLQRYAGVLTKAACRA